MMGLIIRGGAYIRNSLSISEYGGLIHGGGSYIWGGGGGYFRRFTYYLKHE
jgi:hypothetical protein